MEDRITAEASASGNEELRLPEGDYAIVEQLGHRTLIGRVCEVERFGSKLLQIEPLFEGVLLPAIMVGGATLYCFTPCSAEVAAARQPTRRWQLPPSVAALLPPLALPTPDDEDDCLEPTFAPAFLSDDIERDRG